MIPEPRYGYEVAIEILSLSKVQRISNFLPGLLNSISSVKCLKVSIS